MKKKSGYVTTYDEALSLINVRYDDSAKKMLKNIEQNGYTERTISYCIWKCQEKIMGFRGDSRFWSILKNEVVKYGFKN